MYPQRIFYPPQEGEVIRFEGQSYYLGTQIGSGYFGAVYSCVDDWGNPLVAKVILPLERPYEVVRDEWERELQNLIMLRHPNITFVHNAFEYRDTFYLIIERCEKTLADMLATPHFNGEKWLMPIARCLLQAVDFIHRQGYVHKDLHLGNIFLRYIQDEVSPEYFHAMVFKVGDLGISRLVSDMDVFNTMLAQWMLPPEFLAPHAFGPVGQQVDIYHAALVLLTVLLGYRPEFSHEEILDGMPSELALSIPSPYRYPIAKALRRHLAYRTQTAAEFWRNLRDAPIHFSSL